MDNVFDLERSKQAVEAISRVCAGAGRILLLMQNNPDPDSIASAAALREIILSKLHKRATIGYGGRCSRAENQAMMEVLHIDAHRMSQTEITSFRTICLLDTQPLTGNNALPLSRALDVVIDHHIPVKRKRWAARFEDLRPQYGAVSTIMCEYLLAAGVKPHANLATALFYGIESDTQILGREAGPADTAAFKALFSLADKKKLARIRRAPVPAAYFAMLRDGLTQSEVAGATVITRIPNCSNPDMIAEVADLMLRLANVRTAVCYGYCDGTIYLSARAADARGNAAQRMRKALKRLGTGGGHRTMAGGQAPVDGDPQRRLDLVRERVLKAFAPNEEPKPLLDGS